MKTFQKFLTLNAFLIVVMLQAQTFNAGDDELSLEDFKNASTGMNYLTTQQNNTNRTPAINSSVFIDQIGSNNNAVVQTSSNSSEISILQNGSDNQIYTQISANTIDHSVLQNGDNNLFIHSNPFRINTHASQIIQNGDNQNLEWFGGNSISERMKVTMQGEAESIIIRSFN